MAEAEPFISSTTRCSGQQIFTSLPKLWTSHRATVHTKLPHTTIERLISASPETTILYLAYGSNLCAETFKGARGIKPLSAVNVHVPSLDLTFDLAGIPYTEPCFANTRYHVPPSTTTNTAKENDYQKDRWTKGLVGVVYEVTSEDYRTIIATEGGGASYHDVVVPCYTIPAGTKSVDTIPTGTPFKAHTLLRPSRDSEDSQKSTNGGIVRPDPSYAQASARYLKLITSGGEEHSLPDEYMDYLYKIRPYTITTAGQRVGQSIILAVWLPILLFLFGLGKLTADKDGKIPGWLAGLIGGFTTVVWWNYDTVLKRTCGDGERTIGDDGGEDEDEERGGRSWCEKRIVLE
ncbi:uncharacterized protein RSE6_10712 [Rhynchosporium secalis]|uniref:gamma-glutamylcyclotransferase n=1 Tax=Rhynchosporium secalis TaxID=38038 RepID=A0A1E1ML70_RHYSE|nr:uncharacterized protein RSE6_10712 [Rhynchosporium secalis]